MADNINTKVFFLIAMRFNDNNLDRRMASAYDDVTATQPPSNWNQFVGYSEEQNENYPYRVHDTSQRSSLTVIFKVLQSDLNYTCSPGIHGFVVSLHPPNEEPQIYERYFYLPLQKTVLLAVKPQFRVLSKSVRTHDVHLRRCYLYDERPLRFFKHYNANNCRTECWTNATMAQCGCVKFSNPSTLKSNAASKRQQFRFSANPI